MKNKKILVMGDAHVTNGQTLRRFKWANNYIRATNPDAVVIIGDFLTLNSLSAWDRDKRKLMENRRFFKEIDAGNEALDLLGINGTDGPTEKIFIEGNHEDRFRRYIDYHPEFDYSDFTINSLLDVAGRGFKWIPYREYWSTSGVYFTHIPFGKMREITGKDICSKAEAVTTNTVVFGHTHELHTSCVHKFGQKHLQQILNVGCFFEQEEEYVAGKMTNYWKGLVELDVYSYGRFDIKTISMGHLRRNYNGTV